MIEPGRKFVQGVKKYRYGFNEKENDNEVKGEGNQQDYGMRIYDPRLGRFLSEDPITKQYPELTPYQFASNRPIDGIDLDGLEWWKKWVWLISPTLAVTSDNEIKEGIKERAKETAKGLVDLIKNGKTHRISSTIGDPSVKAVDPKVVLNQLENAGKAVYEDYKNLFLRALKGDKKAIGGLIFETLLLATPGAEELGGAIKGLKYAGEMGKCAEYAAGFTSKIEPMLAKIGAKVETFEIKIVEEGIPKGAYIATTKEGLSTSGMHRFVTVTTKEGAEMIFDNMHPNGMLKSDYIKEIAARIESSGKIISGKEIFGKMVKQIPNKVAKKKK